MAIRLISSSSAAARLARRRRFFPAAAPPRRRSSSGPRAARPTIWRATWHAEAGATFGLTRFSLTELASRAAVSRLAARVPGGDPEAVAARAVFDAQAAGELDYFAPVAAMPGFARALARTLHELRLAGVDRRPARSTDGPAAADIGRLLARVEDQLARASVARPRRALPPGRRGVRRLPVGGPQDRLPRRAARVPRRARVCRRDPVARAGGPRHGAGRRRPRARRVPRDGRDARHAPDATRHQVPISRTFAATCSRASGRPSDPARAMSCCSPRLERAARRSRSCAASSTKPSAACRSTRWRCSCARRSTTSACSSTPAPEAACRCTSIAARAVPIRPAARSWRSSRARSKGLSARRFDEYLSLGQVPPIEPMASMPTASGVAASSGRATKPFESLTALAADDDDGTTADAAAIPDVEPDDADPDGAVVAGTLRSPWKWEELIVESAVIGGRTRGDGRERWRRRLNGLEADYRLPPRRDPAGRTGVAAHPALRARARQPAAPAPLRAADHRRARRLARRVRLGRVAGSLRRAGRPRVEAARRACSRRWPACGRWPTSVR